MEISCEVQFIPTRHRTGDISLIQFFFFFWTGHSGSFAGGPRLRSHLSTFLTFNSFGAQKTIIFKNWNYVL